MPIYKFTIPITNHIIEADNEEIAIKKFWDKIDYEFQDLSTYFNDILKIKEICPHCEITLESKMIDVDGTNLEEHFVCPKCGFGTPALR